MVAREVDIVVLGCGNAGAAVALAAKRCGAEVLVLEKQAPERHTPNVRVSGGIVMSLTDAAEGAEYLSGCSGGLVDDELFLPWAERAVQLDKWLESIGLRLHFRQPALWGPEHMEMWAEHPHLAGSRSVRTIGVSTTLPAPYPGAGRQMRATGEVTGGEAIYRGLMHALANQPVDILWGAEPMALTTQDPQAGNRVTGVRARQGGDEFEVRARKGVVIATGGFGGNREMIKQFLSVPNTQFVGNPDNDGSGLKLAMSVGADLVRMNRMVGGSVSAFTLADGRDMGFRIRLHGGHGGGYLVCDQAGHRYGNEYELATEHHSFYHQMQVFDPEDGYTRSPSYLIFDERRRTAGPMTYEDRGFTAFGTYDWSSDNRAEIDAGWIAVGDTPGEAATAAGAADGAPFNESVAAYNATIASGGPDPFGRPSSSLVPLDQPSYYCIRMYCGGPYTNGGARRDVYGRVIGVDGQPITGLFSAGELGQAIGVLYPAFGASIAEALCLGQVTGEYLAGTYMT